jgi:hypothetical protein
MARRLQAPRHFFIPPTTRYAYPTCGLTTVMPAGITDPTSSLHIDIAANAKERRCPSRLACAHESLSPPASLGLFGTGPSQHARLLTLASSQTSGLPQSLVAERFSGYGETFPDTQSTYGKSIWQWDTLQDRQTERQPGLDRAPANSAHRCYNPPACCSAGNNLITSSGRGAIPHRRYDLHGSSPRAPAQLPSEQGQQTW